MVDLDKIEFLYKNHSELLEVVPPPDGWNRIEASLNEKGSDRKAIWWWVTGIAASIIAIVLVGSIIWQFDQKKYQNTMASNNIEQATETIDKKETNSETDKSDSGINHIKKLEKQNDNNLSQSRLLVSLSDNNNQPELNNTGTNQRENLVVAYRHSPIKSLTNYFKTDKVKIKSLKSEHPNINWQDFYKVNSDVTKPTKESTRFGRKVEIGGVYSPVYAYRQISNPSVMPNTMLVGPGPSEKGVVYAGGGLRLNVLINKKWSVESGVRFARLGQEINSQTNVDELITFSKNDETNVSLKRVSLNNSMGIIKHKAPVINRKNDFLYATPSSNYHVEYSFSDNNAKGIIEQNLDYLEVPLSVRYYFINKGVSLSLSAGLSTNWLIGNKVYLVDESDRTNIGETSGLSSLTLSSHAGLAFTFPVTGRLSLQLEPRINYFLSEINKDYAVTYKPYSFGVYSGIQYTIGK